jgi:hypothetical protein
VGVCGGGGAGGCVWGHSLRSTFHRLHLLRLWTPTILLLWVICFKNPRGQGYLDIFLSSEFCTLGSECICWDCNAVIFQQSKFMLLKNINCFELSLTTYVYKAFTLNEHLGDKLQPQGEIYVKNILFWAKMT